MNLFPLSAAALQGLQGGATTDPGMFDMSATSGQQVPPSMLPILKAMSNTREIPKPDAMAVAPKRQATRATSRPSALPNTVNAMQPQQAAPNAMPYADQIAELQRRLDQPDQAMYTPEQIAQRRADNDRQYQLGLLGAMSGDKGLGNVGGMILQQALAARSPKGSERGSFDPITGQWTYDPAWKREQLQNQLDKLQTMSGQATLHQDELEKQEQFKRDMLETQLAGQMDLRRMMAGNVAASRQAGLDAKDMARQQRNWGIEDQMANAYTRDTKEHQAILNNYKRLQAINQGGNAASDMAFIYSYMKLLDPTSVVREGEFASAQNATGIPDQVRNWYNRSRTGNFLNPQQRTDMLGAASRIASTSEKSINDITDQFTKTAQRRGLNIESITGRPAQQGGSGGGSGWGIVKE